MLYSVYGITLKSNVAIDNLRPAEGPVEDISFVQYPPETERLNPATAELLKRSQVSIGGYVTHYLLGATHLFRFEGRADMAFSAEGSTIECWANHGYESWTIDILLGLGLSFALSLRGVGSIHAAAIAIGTGAIGLVAAPGTGKSTLATSLAIAGHPLISDDVLAVHRCGDDFFVQEGPRHVGLEPHKLGLMESTSGVERAPTDELEDAKTRIPLDGYWSDQRSPALDALYLLTRREQSDGSVVLDALGKQEALRALLIHTPPVSFLLNAGYERYWRFLGELVERIPVSRLTYPSGFDRLGDIRAVLEKTHVATT